MGKEVFRHCESLTIYCEAEEKPNGWNETWNVLTLGGAPIPVVWGFQPNE